MDIKVFEKLPEDAKIIRTKVFVEEQNFKNEFDDKENISTHLVMYDCNKPVATARYYFSKEQDSFVIGRIAVLKEYRGQGLGYKILSFTENCIKNKGSISCCVLAQKRVSAFYQKLGYKELGGIIYDEYCPHIWMKKKL